MLLYKRYIIKSILLPLIMIGFIVTCIVWITQILKLLHLIDKGVRLSHFFELVSLVLPALLFIVLPFVTVLAVIYTYNRLSEERQLIILKNSGLNNISLASPALIVAIFVTLFCYYLSAQLMPPSYIKLKSNLSFIKDNYASSIINEKTFNNISKFITIYVNKKLRDGTMEGLVLFDDLNKESPTILFAKRGKFKIFNKKPIFELNDGIRQSYDSNGNLTQLYFDFLSIELVKNKSYEIEKNLYDRDINEYYIEELINPDMRLSESRRIKLIAEGNQRLLWPLYNFILTFLGLSIFLKQPHNKKSHLKEITLTTIAVIMITYLHFTIQNIASKNINIIFFSYANIVLWMLFSIYLYRRKTI